MRGRSARVLFILVSFIVGAVTVGAQQPIQQQPTQTAPQPQQTAGPPLTITAALQLAMEKNPDIAMARLARTASTAGIAVAAERLNPEITYEASKETPKQSITGVYPFELGHKRQYRIDLARAVAATGEASYAQVVVTVRAEVRRTYYEAAAAERRLAFAQDLRDLAIRVRDAAQSRFRAGDVPELEAVQAEVALSAVESELAAARGEVTATRGELNALIGQAPDTPLALVDDFLVGDVPPPAAAIAQALQNNVDLAVLDKRLVEQQYRRAVANSLRTPDVSVGPALTWAAEPEFNVGWRLSFSATLPILATHKAGVIVEDAEMARLRAERDATVAHVTGSVYAAAVRAATAREQLQRYQTETLPRVEALERMAQTSYTSGQTGVVVLLQQLQQARETRQRGLQAAVDFQFALADLEKAIAAAK